MPGLVLFARRWDIGSDDLVFPETIELFLRIAWLVTIAVIFNVHKSYGCKSGELLEVFYIGSLVLVSLHIVVTVLLIAFSMQGSITAVNRRRHVPPVLYFKLSLFIPEFAWIVIGTYWAFADSTDCNHVLIITVKVAALLGWGMFLALIVGFLVLFDPLGKKSRIVPENDMDGNAQRLWRIRCQLICCCATCDEQSKNAFDDIAKLLANFFEGLDLVPTDIAAGLILVQAEQQTQPRRLQLTPIPTSPTDIQAVSTHTVIEVETDCGEQLDRTALDEVEPTSCRPFVPPRSWMTIDNAAHYMQYAVACYGWPIYVYMNPFTGCCKLCCKDCRCCQCMAAGDHVVDDNCCHGHLSAIRMITGIDEEDLVYACFHNRIYETPFYVCVDHNMGAVVVAIRGTMSLRDALTDLTAENETFTVAGVEGDCHAHKGILQAAKYVKDRLLNEGILNKAFRRGQGYDLVIMGHSLGAGTASLLSVLLRPDYPNLRCFAFSPPGGLLSKLLSRHTEDFICSVVLGKDLIPRLGISTMEQLRTKTLRVIRDSNIPKYQILAGGLWNILCGITGAERDRNGQRRHLLEDPATRTRTYTNESVQQSLEDAILSNRTRRICEPLYPPGHILYIEEVQQVSCCGEPVYEAAWAQSDVFDEVIVSPKMLTDHLPDNVLRALDQLAERRYSPRHQVQRQY